MTNIIRANPLQRGPGRPKNPAPAKMGLSDRVRQGVELMVTEGLNMSDAARAIGMSYRKFAEAMRNPVVVQHYRARINDIRSGEAARNLHGAVTIRDNGLVKEASAADRRVALEAMRYIDGEAAGGGHGARVNISITPGYAIDLSDRPRVKVIDPDQDLVIRVDDGVADRGDEYEDSL